MINNWFSTCASPPACSSIGLYALLTMRNMIKLFIGIEVIGKGVSLVLLRPPGSPRAHPPGPEPGHHLHRGRGQPGGDGPGPDHQHLPGHTKSLDVRKLTQLQRITP